MLMLLIVKPIAFSGYSQLFVQRKLREDVCSRRYYVSIDSRIDSRLYNSPIRNAVIVVIIVVHVVFFVVHDVIIVVHDVIIVVHVIILFYSLQVWTDDCRKLLLHRSSRNCSRNYGIKHWRHPQYSWILDLHHVTRSESISIYSASKLKWTIHLILSQMNSFTCLEDTHTHLSMHSTWSI